VCFVPGRIRPIALVSIAYVLITAFAALFQSGDLGTILFGWLAEGPQPLQGHANVNKVLALAGLRAWMFPVSLGLLIALGVWVFRNRRAERWLLLGVIAIVGRFFIHHRLYDDLLLFVPMVALFRIAKRGPADGSDVTAGILFTLMLGSLVAPAQLIGAPGALSLIMEVGQAATWLGALAFLARRRRQEQAPEAAPVVVLPAAEAAP